MDSVSKDKSPSKQSNTAAPPKHAFVKKKSFITELRVGWFSRSTNAQALDLDPGYVNDDPGSCQFNAKQMFEYFNKVMDQVD